MGKKFPVVVIEHVDDDGEPVYCWGEESGMKTLRSCLKRGETVEVHLTKMTEKQFEAMPDYEGEC